MRFPQEIQTRLKELRRQAHECGDVSTRATLMLQIHELEWVLQRTEWQAEEELTGLDDTSIELFHTMQKAMVEASQGKTNAVALGPAFFMGKPVPTIVLVDEEANTVWPAYIELTRDIMDMMHDPRGLALIEGAEETDPKVDKPQH